MKDLIGWAASCLIVITTVSQICKQVKDHTSKGVSAWLFIGNLAASGLFCWYAVLIHNVVYTVTNVVMVAASLTGLMILSWHRRGHSKA